MAQPAGFGDEDPHQRRQRFPSRFSLPVSRRPYHLPHTLSPDECGRLIRAGATLQERLALSLLYGCGLKPGEACMLRWEDVDTDLRALRVRRPTSRLRPRLSGAPAAAVRCVPIPADWAKWLCETATLSSPGAPMLSDGGGRGRARPCRSLPCRARPSR